MVGAPVAGFGLVLRKTASVESGKEVEGEKTWTEREKSQIGNDVLDHQVVGSAAISPHLVFDVLLFVSASGGKLNFRKSD